MPKLLHVTHFSPWAQRWTPTELYLREFGRALPTVGGDPAKRQELLRMAVLDRAWHAEISRCFAALQHPEMTFAPGRVVGAPGLVELLAAPRIAGEERWLVFNGQDPQRLAPVLEKVLPPLRQAGWCLALYGFDEVSRRMPAFALLAPHLDILVHDEAPLAPAGEALLSPTCLRTHRSWVANLLPQAAPWVEAPEEKVLFLGSQMGLTPNRQKQLDALRRHFKDRLVAIHDHSVSVADRLSLGRYKVSHCPEGRMFGTPAMAATHTDRPFWSGCLGMVPVSEDSETGGRLESLAQEGLLLRYAHADTRSLIEQCEKALALPNEARRRIYDHYNRHEVVGAVLADHLARAARG